MNVDTDTLASAGMPAFLEQTGKLLEWMRALSREEAQALWKCNDKIAEQNYQRFQEMELSKNLTPAIIAYEGIQYQYMAPAVFGGTESEYVQEHLRILSGFYGVLKPFDGVVPYRLEMQAKASDAGDSVPVLGRPDLPGSDRGRPCDSEPCFKRVFQVRGEVSAAGRSLHHLCFRGAFRRKGEAERDFRQDGEG